MKARDRDVAAYHGTVTRESGQGGAWESETDGGKAFSEIGRRNLRPGRSLSTEVLLRVVKGIADTGLLSRFSIDATIITVGLSS